MIPSVQHTTFRHWLFRLSRVAALFALAGLAAYATQPTSARAQQKEPVCTWKELGNLNRSVFYPAAAMDTDSAVMYVYGGTSDPSANWQTQNAVSGITFGATLSRGDTRAAAVQVNGAQEREALAGVYRSKGDASAVYWIGGRNNTGVTNDEVYAYTIKTMEWKRLATTGSFGNRNEHVAAYDPKHDAIWVAAGEPSTCSAVPCTAPQIPTNYLTFDASTGAASWHDGPSGGPRAKGGSMVYDSRKERMLLFGGTIDGDRGTNQLYALDLADPDISKAKWSQLSATGAGPQVAVHAAVYDPDHNWMVVYGGMKNSYAVGGKESAETRTFALDLSTEPPTWRNLNTSIGERIQTVAAYLPKHKAMILTSGRVPLEEPVQPNVTKRSIHALECVEAPDVATPTPPPASGGAGVVCPRLASQAPRAAIDLAMANPASVNGWGQRCIPSQPAGPTNGLRTQLGLQNASQVYHPLFNGLTWRCGCR